MNLLISDYDGTFKSENKNYFIRKLDIKLNTIAVKKFIKNGNKFVINTGRRLISIQEEIKKYNISYDYTICNNGLVAFDNSNNIIFSNCLNKKIVEYTKKLYEQKIVTNLLLVNETGENVYNDKIIKINVKSNNIVELKKHLNEIQQNYENVNISHDLFKNIFSIHQNCDKSTGIEELLESISYKFDNSSIYTIGDSKKDIEMIRKYNGYYIENSNLEYVFLNNSMPNVRTLIKKIN